MKVSEDVKVEGGEEVLGETTSHKTFEKHGKRHGLVVASRTDYP